MKTKTPITKTNLIVITLIIVLTSFFSFVFAQNFPIKVSDIFDSNKSPISPKQGALQLQQTLRQIAKERSPSVVHVGATIVLDKQTAEHYGLPQENEVTGSGFIVSKKGYVITNYHVIEGASDYTVKLSTGETFYAGLIGFDQKTDIALLRFQPNGRNLPTMPIGDSDELKVGDIVIAIGNPWGLSGSMTMGIVSATGRIDQKIEEEAILKNYIQTDVPINQGNSGGPLINLNGEAVGINSALFTSGGGWDGISFSIPMKVVKRVIEDLADDGVVERGFLGIYYKALDNDMADYFGVGKNEGVLVTEVLKGSPAEKGGLKVGDVIIEYNGEIINTFEELLNRVLASRIGEKVQVTIIRNGKKKKINIVIKKRPKDLGKDKEELRVNNFGTTSWLGMELGNYEMFSGKIVFDDDGLVVVSVKEGSKAYEKGILPGDIITEINNRKIIDIQELSEYSNTNGRVFLIKLYRSGKYDIIAIKG